jgi:hypothetical protein
MYLSDREVHKKDEYYPDHADEKWSQLVGFRSPQEMELENVSIYVKELDSGITLYTMLINKFVT